MGISLGNLGFAQGLSQAGANISRGLLQGRQQVLDMEYMRRNQAIAEARTLLGMYDKINDPEAFTQIWNTWVQKRGLTDWPTVTFNKRSQEGDVFTTRDGRMWLKKPGELAPLESTPEEYKRQLKEEQTYERQQRAGELEIQRKTLRAREAEIENRRKALEVAELELKQGRQISGETLRYLIDSVKEYYMRLKDAPEEITEEEKRLYQRMEGLLNNYLSTTETRAGGGPSLGSTKPTFSRGGPPKGSSKKRYRYEGGKLVPVQ